MFVWKASSMSSSFSILVRQCRVWYSWTPHGSEKSLPILSDMLSVFVKPSCAVVNHGLSGLEVIVMGLLKLDIYNFGKNEWRNGPDITRVSFFYYWEIQNRGIPGNSFDIPSYPLASSPSYPKVGASKTAIFFFHVWNIYFFYWNWLDIIIIVPAMDMTAFDFYLTKVLDVNFEIVF